MVVTSWDRAGQYLPHLGPDSALVIVYALDVLAADRPPRVVPPRVAVELVSPDRHLVIGRRGSPDDPSRGPDGDGVRLALPQTGDPLTSRRHLELVHRGRWMVQVLETVAQPAHVRDWGSLQWTEAPAGTPRLLEKGRPLAVRLPGEPGYVVTFVTRATWVRPPVPRGDGGTTKDLTEPTMPVVDMTQTQREGLARIYHDALQWPPNPGDDPAPSWACLPNEGSLRKAFRTLRGNAEAPLGLTDRPGPDELLLNRLIESSSLTYDAVADVADACDLPLDPPSLR
jgi:hypothetical protein